MAFFTELKRRNVFKVGIAYLLVAWIIAQVVDVVDKPLHLPDWFDTTILLLLAIGFPVALVLAWAYELTPTGIKRDEEVPRGETGKQPASQKFNYVLLGLLGGAVLGSASVWLLKGDRDMQWARDEAIPRIETSIAAGDWEGVFALARQVQARLTHEPKLLEDLWPRFSWLTTIPSDPPGATVYRRPYDGNDDDWQELGVTPLENIRIPFGLSRVRLELAGHVTLETTLGGGLLGGETLEEKIGGGVGNITPRLYHMDTEETLPPGMVRVPGWRENIGGETVPFSDYFLGRYEVTNREYQKFIDAGGYERKGFWEHPFILDGQTISWEDAMARFQDKTGRPGPSTWVAGTYPDGQKDYPVAGVSWYEAAAYARFAGGELPTIYHWRWAYATGSLTWMLPASNMEGSSTAQVGRFKGLSWSGTYDMAGNVREWTFNTVGNLRFIPGGGWNDPYYIGIDVNSAQAPFDRSETNGLRLAITRDRADVMVRASAPLPEPVVRNYRELKPVSDEGFEAYRALFAYDSSTPLDATLETGQESPHWTRQHVSFNAAYNNERMKLYLFLPHTSSPPYQTVLYCPGSDGFFLTSLDQYSVFLDFVLKSGRAVAFPVYKEMFERGDGGGIPFTNMNEVRIKQIKDLRRSIDYLETRSDIDAGSLGYFGYSWGSGLGPYVLTLEPRVKTGVLYAAGFFPTDAVEGNVMQPIHYLPRIKVPVLMLNGELDNLYSLETSAKPFFDLIGTPAADKKLVIAQSGHFVPRDLLIRETLDWLDKYMGRPRQGM